MFQRLTQGAGRIRELVVVRKDAAHCQRIEIAPLSEGWMVTEDGKPAGVFDSPETAYQRALAICAELFERGVPSRVYELATPA